MKNHQHVQLRGGSNSTSGDVFNLGTSTASSSFGFVAPTISTCRRSCADVRYIPHQD